MGYKKDITDVLDDTIDAMELTVEVISVTDNNDGTFTLECDDILHAQKGFLLTINTAPYEIMDFCQADETITVKGDGAIAAGDTFEMYVPHFYHGTPIATNIELNQVANAADKTPLIWLWENFKEKNIDDLSPVDREIDLELFFLTQPPERLQLMLTDDLYSQCIKPMRRLLENFIKAVKLDTANFDADELPYDTENYAKFGIVARNRGTDKSILLDNLSGIGVKIKLRLFSKENC